MNDMRLTAQQLAARGRFGDTMLIHVNPAEVAGIASLIPGGLTVNPETGLPEAFFFLPFLASLFSAAAPAAAAAAPLAAAGTAATGLGATLGTLGTAAGTGLSTLTSLLPEVAAPTLASAGTAAGAAGTAAAALPAVTSAIPVAAPAAAAAAPAASAALPGITSAIPISHSSLIGAGTAAPGYTAAANAANPLVTSVGAGTSAPAYTTAANTAAAGTTTLPATTTVGIPSVANAATPIAEKTGGMFGKFGEWITKNPMMAMGIGSQLIGSLGKLGGGKKKKSSKNSSDYKYAGGDPDFSSNPADAGQIEHNFYPKYDYNAYAANGGLVRGYANGGIVSLAEGGPVDPQAQMPQDMTFPLNGVPGTDEAPMLADIPSSEFPTSQIGSTPEPAPEDEVQTPTNNDKELIAQTVEAIQGKIPDPGPVLLAFVNEFGEPALQDLAQRVKGLGQQQQGQGDGTSDSIPARLSEGEFVVPADTVSALGNGSTEAGGRQLQGMVDGVRTAKTGAPQMPPPIPEGGIASMMRGGLVR